jgi:hypothetical protein
MKEITNLVKVTPIPEATNTQKTFHADTFEFAPERVQSDSGISYNCDLDLVIDTPSDTICKQFATPVSSIVRLSDSVGATYILGKDELPTKVMIQKQLNKSRLIIRYISIDPVI